MLQDLEIVVGFDGVANDRAQTLQSLFVSLDVPRNLGLAVQIERPPFDGFHDVIDLDALAAKKPIRVFGEAVTERGRFGLGFGGVLGQYGPKNEGFERRRRSQAEKWGPIKWGFGLWVC